MRISDWSSDVCSSDLGDHAARDAKRIGRLRQRQRMAQPPFEEGAHIAMPGCRQRFEPQHVRAQLRTRRPGQAMTPIAHFDRSEEHTSELQSLMRISYAVFCLKKKKTHQYKHMSSQI